MDGRREKDQGSCIVIADTHLGLVPDPGKLAEAETCDPAALVGFINWLVDLKNKKVENELELYDEGGDASKKLEPPSMLILLGDIVDLWDSTEAKVEFSSRPLFSALEKLDCEKIYVLGNHDYEAHRLFTEKDTEKQKKKDTKKGRDTEKATSHEETSHGFERART